MEFEITQQIELTKYRIDDKQIMDYLKDYKFVSYDARTKVLNYLIKSESTKFIEKLHDNTELKNNDKNTYDEFLKFIYDFIVTAQTEIGNQTFEQDPTLDPNQYEPPYEHIQHETQLETDVINSILSNWSLSYRINRLCLEKSMP